MKYIFKNGIVYRVLLLWIAYVPSFEGFWYGWNGGGGGARAAKHISGTVLINPYIIKTKMKLKKKTQNNT